MDRLLDHKDQQPPRGSYSSCLSPDENGQEESEWRPFFGLILDHFVRFLSAGNRFITLLGPQSRFGGKLLIVWVLLSPYIWDCGAKRRVNQPNAIHRSPSPLSPLLSQTAFRTPPYLPFPQPKIKQKQPKHNNNSSSSSVRSWTTLVTNSLRSNV